MSYIQQDATDIRLGFRAKWFSNNAGWYNSFIVMSLISLIFLTLTSLTNFTILYLLIRLKNNYKKSQPRIFICNYNEKYNFEKEKNFFVMVVVSFLGQLILVIDNYVTGIFSQKKEFDKFYVMVMIFPIVNDITILPGTWTLVCISRPLRVALHSLWFCKVNKISTNNIFDGKIGKVNEKQ